VVSHPYFHHQLLPIVQVLLFVLSLTLRPRADSAPHFLQA
jgi:hypothetical protein